MTRLVDADALKYDFGEINDGSHKWWDLYVTNEVIARQPTIDAVQVIRCIDCVYFTPEKSGEHWNICRFYDAPKTADGFCNDAEPKETE